MQGSIQAIKEMEQDGFTIYLCSSPILTSNHCVQEKINWVRHHLGEEWVRKLILTTDKAAVRGDILIDDKPLGICIYLSIYLSIYLTI
jgi:5'(3')-deoxyribonucleotidase